MPTPKRFTKVPDVKCPSCSSTDTIRFGTRIAARKTVQIYKCRSCNGSFTTNTLKYTQYPASAIVTSITNYNIGHTLEETRDILSRRHRLKVPLPTVHSWVRRYTDICTFTTMRNRYALDPAELVKSKKLQHRQVYNFKIHTLKLNIAAKKFPTLRKYLYAVYNRCPDDLFTQENRCSTFTSEKVFDSLSRERPLLTKVKGNNAMKLAELALVLAKRNVERHEAVQDVMLINDTATVAVEVPVYLSAHELKAYGMDSGTPITGHIDVVQVRWDKIYILDYKPELRADAKTVSQLYMYGLALSKRTGIPLERFRCAFFNDRSYYEFDPCDILNRK